MALSDDCLCGRSQLFTFESNDKIVIDRETFNRILSLVGQSVNELNNVRHREVFLDCLNTYLVESPELDDSDCFRASLLLDAYYEYVPATLGLLSDNLQKTFELMQGFKHHD